MRASIAILAAVVAVFTSSGLASASNPVQLQQTVPGATNKVENADGGTRFLRERLEDESDVLTSEERGFLGDLATKAKRAVKGEYFLARLFKKDYQQLKNRGVTPEYLGRAANTLEHAGWDAAKVRGYRRRVEGYDRYYYTLLNWKV